MAEHTVSYDPEARMAGLDERVLGIDRRQQQLETAMSRGFSAVENSITSLATEFRSGSKPQWQAFSLLATIIIAVLGFVGTLVFFPVKTDIQDLKQSIQQLASVSVGKADLEYRLDVSGKRRDDFQRLSENRDAELMKGVDLLREKIVPRGEHEQIWQNFRDRQSDLQRQIDETKKFQAGLVSAPDYLKGLDERLRLIEMKNLRP
jgi:methyl-accepting chemotaxis protein